MTDHDYINKDWLTRNFEAINSFMKETRGELDKLKVENEHLKNTITTQQLMLQEQQQRYGMVMAKLNVGATS